VSAPPEVFVVREVAGRLKVRMPYVRGTRAWWGERGFRPGWDGTYWRIARPRMAEAVDLLLSRWPEVGIEIHGHSANLCDTRCQEALGLECVCSCAGRHHGGGLFGTPVGETAVLVDSDVVVTQYVVRRGWSAAGGAA
jgi:hypothetical protein